MRRIVCPKECPECSATCHSTCKGYIEWVKENNAEKERIRRIKDQEDAVKGVAIESAIRRRKRY